MASVIERFHCIQSPSQAGIDNTQLLFLSPSLLHTPVYFGTHTHACMHYMHTHMQALAADLNLNISRFLSIFKYCLSRVDHKCVAVSWCHLPGYDSNADCATQSQQPCEYSEHITCSDSEHTHTLTHTRTYTHTHTRTRIHTHTHTHTHSAHNTVHTNTCTPCCE